VEHRTGDLIFVYGSLRRGCANDAARVLHAGSEWIGTGWLHGSLSDIDGYPALTPCKSGRRVEGDIFRMRDPDAMLSFIDDYEDCAPTSPTPHDYVRVAAAVATEVGSRRAWVYIANSTR
jgi:gamma-glutamylcyclotransferase (GGCT)/AIG2-like uncharacterized protein YtfP